MRHGTRPVALPEEDARRRREIRERRVELVGLSARRLGEVAAAGRVLLAEREPLSTRVLRA